MAHQEFGPKLLERIMVELSGLAEKDRQERMEGRRFVTVLKPAKGAVINQKPSVTKIPEGKQETKNAKPSSIKIPEGKQETVIKKPEETKSL